MKVLVFGYSDNPERYSNMAYHLLLSFNHEVIKLNPRVDEIKRISHEIDTITLYVSKPVSDKFTRFFLDQNFKRIIFNPGTENIELEELLLAKGLEVVHGCTLVMLKTGQF